MGAVTRNLQIEQGTTWSATWQIKLDGAFLDPDAGWQARSQVRAKKTDAAVLHEFDAKVIGSMVYLSVLPDVSSAWTWRRGVYDIEIYDNGAPSRVVRVVQGTINVSAEITREPA